MKTGEKRENRNLPFDGEKLLGLMEQENLDLLLLNSRHNLRYLTGGYVYPLYVWDAHTKGTLYLPFLGIPAGDLSGAFYAGRPGEAALIREKGLWLENLHESGSISTRAGAETAVTVLRERFPRLRRVGVELPCLPADAWQILRKGLPEADFTDASRLMDRLRAVKSPREIGLYRKGSLLNLEGVRRVMNRGGEGMTTQELAESLEREFRSLDVHFLYSLICAGPSYFRFPSPRCTWESGRILHIDTGCLLEGYVVETCRMASRGEPSGEARELMSRCAELRQEALKLMRPGTSCGTLQRGADDFLRRRWPGTDGHFVAHGIGLVHHEEPEVHRDSEAILEPGMILSIEMEFRTPETGHVKIEELVLITPEGGEILTPGGAEWTVSP